MKNSPIIILSILTVGIVTGILLKNSFDQPASIEDSSTQNSTELVGDIPGTDLNTNVQLTIEINKLQQLLKDEINARQSLQNQFESLSRQVASLNQDLQRPDEADVNEAEETDDHSNAENANEDWFNTQALIDSGMSSREANDLKTFFEQQELDRMYLRDQSIREDWDRQKFREEMQILRDKSDALLDNLNDDAYDAFLYASGQPNRVEVTSVLENAQAGSVGIRAGDRIISYDNKRIYSGFELRTATAGGNINDSIIVVVERDGEILEFYLARGPLGIRMNSVSEAPTR